MSTVKLYKKGVKTKITDNFVSTEFDCSCSECQWTKIDVKHVERLQLLRDELGPLKVTSAYRCETHNKRVGGASRSRHLEGDATDVQSSSKSPEEVAQAAEKLNFCGIGRYNTFIHLDSRGYSARWNFRK